MYEFRQLSFYNILYTIKEKEGNHWLNERKRWFRVSVHDILSHHVYKITFQPEWCFNDSSDQYI